MPDNRVDSILLEIDATTDKADGGIDKVTKALTSMKKITEGLDTEKLKQILDVMRGFSGVGDDLKNAGSGMRSIASSIKSLSGVDTAKLKEVAATVKEVSTALGNLGSNNRVSIRIDSEGAQRRVQPLENGQQAAAATESVATASEEAQAAMNGAASAASQLAQEESNLGTAGQSAAAGQTNLNESLNQANTNPANRRIQELIDQINKYKATVSGMESGKIRFDTGQYEEAVNGLRQAQEQFKQFKETVSQSPKNMEDVAKSIKSIGDAAQKCGLGTFSSILSGIASILPAIETGGMAANAGFQSMAVGLETVQSAIPIIGIILTILTAIINAVRQVANAVKNEVQKVISTVKTLANKIRSCISAIINKFKELKKRVRESLGFSEKQSGAFAKKLGSIFRLGTFMLLRSMFTHLFELVKTGFDNLVIYSKRAGTEFHKNVNLLYNDLRQLGASLTTAFEPILNVVTPILDYLIQKLIAATNALAQFFSALTGKKFYTKAIRQNKDYADSLNSAAKAAKNLTTGIDELNILSDDKSGSGSNSGADGSGYETDAVADKYKDLAEMVKDAWADADFTEIGRMFGEKLKDALENIPWDGIKATMRKIAKSIATFLNGFLETPGLFTEIGVTIAQAINSAFEFVDSFVENFHWSSLGTAIANLIIGALDTLDWTLINKTVKGLAQGIVDAINAALQTEDLWKKIGTAISNTINSAITFAKTFVKGLDWASLGTAIGNLLGNAIAGIDYVGIGETFAGFVNGVFTAVLNFSKTFPWTDIAKNFASGVNTALGNLDWETIKSGFDAFCSGLGSNLNAAITNIDWELVGTTLGNSVKTLFSGLGKFLAKIDFKKIGSDFASAINKAVKTIDWKEAGGTINSLITGVCTLINTLIDEVDWYELLKGVGTAMSEIDWDTILKTVFKVFATKWTFKNLFKWVSWTAIWNELKTSVVEGISKKFGIGSDDGEINTVGENIVSGLLKGITRSCLPAPLQTTLDCFNTITDIVKKIFGIHSPSTVFAEIGDNIVAGLINGITGKFTDCKNKVLEWANKVNEWFSGTSFGKICKETWETHGQNIITGFKDKIGSAYTTTRDKISTWANDVKDYFSGSSHGAVNNSTWTTYANDVITGFRDKIGNTYTTVRNNISTWANDIKDYFSGSGHGKINSTEWQTYANNVITGFRDKIGNTYTSVRTNISTWASDVRDYFTGSSHGNVNATKFADYAKGIIDGFKNKVNTYYTTVQSTMNTFASSVKTWFEKPDGTTLVSKFMDIGKNVIQGFIDGVNSLWDTAMEKIKAFGKSIISKGKEGTEEHSPSRAFKQIGAYVVEGFNIGVDSKKESTRNVMESWLDFSDMNINLGTRLKINDSALKEYSNNYGSNFTNEAIVQRVTREVSTRGTVQATLNSGGGLKDAIKEALDDLGITTAVNDISRNTKTQADKKEQTIVEIGGKTVTDAVTTQRNANGYSFQGA